MVDIFLFINFYFSYFSLNWDWYNNRVIFLIVLINIFLINFLLCRLARDIIDYQRKIRDIKSKYDQEIEKYFEKISDLNKMVETGNISLGVYHDLANILTASNLALHEIFVKSKKFLDINELVKKIFNINKQANDLIKSFKKQCSHEEFKTKFCFQQEIERVLSVFNFYFIKHNIKVNIKCDNGLKFFGDSIKFGQMLSNLVSNSIDSLCQIKREKKIDIKVFKNNKEIKIVFSDSGDGIDSKILDKVFKPFFSLSDNNDKHCGIGLTIVKRIIEKDFSGKVLINSKLNQGTIFYISLLNQGT
jgi:signal transduction histidine kinase